MSKKFSKKLPLEKKFFEALFVSLLLSCSEGEVQPIGNQDTEGSGGTFGTSGGAYQAGSSTISTGSSTSSGNVVTVMPNLVEVSFITEATNWNGTTDASFDASKLPFNNGNYTNILGDGHTGGFTLNTQYTSEFNFTYPPNNFQLTKANLIVDTAKDSSDTEGIWLDGVFTGVPPSVNADTSLTTDAWYKVNAYDKDYSNYNYYYIENGFLNYVIDKRNTFNFDMREVFKSPADNADPDLQLTNAYDRVYNNLIDGNLKMVLGDDSPIYKAYLVIKGYTVATDTLVCTNSPTYTMAASLLHRDGLKPGSTSAFTSGCSASAPSDACESASFYFEPSFPEVPFTNITISANPTITFNSGSAGSGTGNVGLDRTNGTDPVAIIMSGLGVAEPGFNKALADSSVTWLADKNIGTLIGMDSSAGYEYDLTVDLQTIFGLSNVKAKMEEGALLFEFAGFKIDQSEVTSTRDYKAQRSGPELNFAASYYTEVCQVEDNPNSPLSQSGAEATVTDDGNPPTIGNILVSDITSDSVTIVWNTSEYASGTVKYGISSVAEDSVTLPTSNLVHEVTLTGLSSYTFYKFQVESIDSGGNGVTSDIIEFITKR